MTHIGAEWRLERSTPAKSMEAKTRPGRRSSRRTPRSMTVRRIVWGGLDLRTRSHTKSSTGRSVMASSSALPESGVAGRRQSSIWLRNPSGNGARPSSSSSIRGSSQALRSSLTLPRGAGFSDSGPGGPVGVGQTAANRRRSALELRRIDRAVRVAPCRRAVAVSTWRSGAGVPGHSRSASRDAGGRGAASACSR